MSGIHVHVERESFADRYWPFGLILFGIGFVTMLVTLK
jgi:hypothetical protein